jgi:hypothetical protein
MLCLRRCLLLITTKKNKVLITGLDKLLLFPDKEKVTTTKMAPNL